jgi:hypothetical protein
MDSEEQKRKELEERILREDPEVYRAYKAFWNGNKAIWSYVEGGAIALKITERDIEELFKEINFIPIYSSFFKGNIPLVILVILKNAISNNLGKMNDIPIELANTIANIYLRFLSLIYDMGPNPPYCIPISIKLERQEGEDFRNASRNFDDIAAHILADINAINKFTINLRKIDPDKQPNLYRYAVTYILDDIKYNIKHVKFKPEIWRNVERIFKKQRVKEIPTLAKLLNI